MIFIKIITDLVCGACFSLGGWHILWMRRYLMPFVLAVSASLSLHTWWIGGLCLPTMGTLCLGYFKIGKAGRGLWLFIQAIALSLGFFLTHHLAWYFFVPYCVLAGVLGGLYVSWFQPIGDAIVGCYLGLIIFCIH